MHFYSLFSILSLFFSSYLTFVRTITSSPYLFSRTRARKPKVEGQIFAFDSFFRFFLFNEVFTSFTAFFIWPRNLEDKPPNKECVNARLYL